MSVDGYARIPAPLPVALERSAAWIGLPELDPPRRMRSRDAFDLATVGNEWRGVAVFAHEANGWTVFDDYTGYLGNLPATRMAARSDEE